MLRSLLYPPEATEESTVCTLTNGAKNFHRTKTNPSAQSRIARTRIGLGIESIESVIRPGQGSPFFQIPLGNRSDWVRDAKRSRSDPPNRDSGVAEGDRSDEKES